MGETHGGTTSVDDSTSSSTSPVGTRAAGGQVCQPWYEPSEAPPGFDHVGVCTLP